MTEPHGRHKARPSFELPDDDHGIDGADSDEDHKNLEVRLAWLAWGDLSEVLTAMDNR